MSQPQGFQTSYKLLINLVALEVEFLDLENEVKNKFISLTAEGSAYQGNVFFS